jgi:tRNA(fMet)-specific endonuclease VapC
MTVFDTDVFGEILLGNSRFVDRKAYELLGRSLKCFRQRVILSYSDGADSLFETWRKQKVRVFTHDMRIAAIAVNHSATLVSRNRRDFERIPGLSVEFWD